MTRMLAVLLALLWAAPLSAQTPADRLRAARAAQNEGRLDDAVEMYSALTSHPDLDVRATALEGAALVLSWNARYDDAVRRYRQLRDLAPLLPPAAAAEKTRAARYGAARTLGWGRQHQEGLRELEPLVKAYPRDREIRLLEAQIAGWGGFTSHSVRAFRDVLRMFPDDKEAQLGLAKVLSWGSRLGEAQREFEKLVDRDPGFTEALIGLTYVSIWQGRAHSAREWFQKIPEKDQASREYRIAQAAVEWAEGNRGDAVRHRLGLMHEFPGEPDLRDLWRTQTGAIGPLLRGEGSFLRDSEGLAIGSATSGGALRISNAGSLFFEGRKEWLSQEGAVGGPFGQERVDVSGGRVGLDWAFGRPLGLRGGIGVRRSDLETGGTVGGLSLTSRWGDTTLTGGFDTDFAFFTPRAVHNDVRMRTFSVGLLRPMGSRLSVNAAYSRTHYEGPDSGVPVPGVDQNRDLFRAAVRHQTGGFGTAEGNFRFDLGARGLYFRFDRQFPEVGYWNPSSFAQVMGAIDTSFRRGEEFSVITSASLGVQRQSGQDWGPALYLYGEFLRQLSRRVDLWGRADFANSGFTRQTNVGKYRAWSVGGGLLVRLGTRTPAVPRNAVTPAAVNGGRP
jgi:tetratricopeptide (TPR) repeat protein